MLIAGESSNGRTLGFGPSNRGSSPCSPAMCMKHTLSFHSLHLLVGRLVLVQVIGVRVPVPQLAKFTTPMRRHWGFSFALGNGTRKTEAVHKTSGASACRRVGVERT